MYKLSSAARSEKKDRIENEDSFYRDDKLGLYILADGMHGYNGKKASNFCVEFLSKKIKKGLRLSLVNRGAIEGYIYECNQNLSSLYLKNIQKGRYGSTLDVVWFDKNRFHIFHLGDSRVYGLRKDKILEQLTEDDTIGAEKVRQGILDIKDYEINKFNKGLLVYQPQYEQVTNGMGKERLENILVKSYNRQDYNFILLTTDGVTDLVTNKEINEIILNNASNLTSITERIMERVNNPRGVIELNIKHNSYKLNELFKQFQKKGIDYESFQLLSNILNQDKYKFAKEETIQSFCNRYPELNDLFMAAMKTELIKEKDNASLIIIQNKERKDGITRFFRRRTIPINIQRI